jgi:hypothetical protein
VEEGTATTVVLVEFKRFKIGMVLGDLECITLLTMLENKNAVRGPLVGLRREVREMDAVSAQVGHSLGRDFVPGKQQALVP